MRARVVVNDAAPDDVIMIELVENVLPLKVYTPTVPMYPATAKVVLPLLATGDTASASGSTPSRYEPTGVPSTRSAQT